MKDVNLIEPAHELTSRARPSSSSARLQTEPSRANSMVFFSFLRVSYTITLVSNLHKQIIIIILSKSHQLQS
ncbi:hypothetical protein HanXRQr2_Chr13g0605321 [Helianthus annuus]|uniref:Uncharacterized protein n=1 Tax=Helianthus annuus TaxID=4232 RepID=A0A9K3EK90_HELAN|nr:hypothetical protein HanXRQr2_Chr13g0605321 [Helianthus annuus]KAJ0850652.1 hypothetical protein HanPSC8_Chr13g0583331 [Helianthus annuus]